MSDNPPASSIFKRKDRCGIEGCRSRRYYKESGRTLCLEGHEQPEFEVDDTGGDSQRLQGQRRSRIKRPRVEKVSQIQRGSPGLLLYLQSYQIILQKQCQALINIVGLPSEFETLVKDLWALRLQHMTEKLGEGDAQNGAIFNSQLSENEDLQEEDNTAAKWKTKSLPTLIETLALCYLASITLRLPLSIGDLHRYAVTEVVPFVRAIRFVPSILKKRMPAEHQLALDTVTPIGPDHIRKAVHHLCLLYQFHFSIKIPSLNVPPLICRYIKDLALPLETYRTTTALASMLSIDFAFPPPRGRQRVSALPEVMLISLIVIAVKLYHSFDGRTRCVSDAHDRTAFAIDWDVWADSLREHQARLEDGDHLAHGDELYLTEDDALHMSNSHMDDYLDWYERTWVDETRAEQAPRGVSRQLLDMFPVSGESSRAPYEFDAEATKIHESKMTEVRDTMRKVRVRQVIESDAESDADDNDPPVGALYKRYRNIDDLTPHARVFHEALAKSAAINLGILLTAVLQVESRVLEWRRRELKAESKDDDVGEEEPRTSSVAAEGNLDDDQE